MMAAIITAPSASTPVEQGRPQCPAMPPQISPFNRLTTISLRRRWLRLSSVNCSNASAANHQRNRLVAGVPADARHNRHERRERHKLLNRRLEEPDEPRRHERGDQIHEQPRRTIARRLPDRREQILGAAEAGHRERILVSGDADEIDDGIDGQPADQLASIVHDRHRYEIVSLERARGLRRGVGRPKRQRIGVHDGGDDRVGLCEQPAPAGSPRHAAGFEHPRRTGDRDGLADPSAPGDRAAPRRWSASRARSSTSALIRRPTDCARIFIGLLEKLSVDLAQRLTHVAHDLVGQVVGDPREVVGVERRGDLDEPMRVGLDR